MKRNLILVLVIVLGLFLVVGSTRRILTFKTTASKVGDAQANLENLKKENEDLKRDLEYKKSQQFAEEEIRNKLGLVKEGESIVVLPKNESDSQQQATNKTEKPNWQKWKELFLGS